MKVKLVVSALRPAGVAPDGMLVRVSGAEDEIVAWESTTPPAPGDLASLIENRTELSLAVPWATIERAMSQLGGLSSPRDHVQFTVTFEEDE